MSGRRALSLLIFLSSLPALALPISTRGGEPQEGKVHVTVVSILATTQNDKIDEKAKEIANEVQKKMPELTGFAIATTTRRSMVLGTKEDFTVVDKNEVTVEARACKDNANRVCLQVKAPTLESLTYTCAYSKYFPIVTGYETKKGERLIIAVMVDLPKAK
jgi:hypothetical protein